MNRNPVTSSQILSIGHDPALNKLHVEFHGRPAKGDKPEVPPRVYEYDDVSKDEADRLTGAPSIYSHFCGAIKGKKQFRAL